MYNWHYIRIDENNRVIRGFSDAFETPDPLKNDICITEEGGRQFELFGVINPPLTSINKTHLYKYVDGEVIETTQAEQDAELASFPIPVVKLSVEERLAIAEDTINFVLGL